MATANWHTWHGMAKEAQTAAQTMEAAQLYRSCASRIYYAAYQGATAVLLYRGLPPPADREAWSHEETPRLIVEHWAPLIPSVDQRKDLARRLGTLYKLRLRADYIGSGIVDALAVREAMRAGSYIGKVVEKLLPER